MSDDNTATQAEPTASDTTQTNTATVDPVVAKEVDAFAGDVKGALEVNGAEPEEQDADTEENNDEEQSEDAATDETATADEDDEVEEDEKPVTQEKDEAGIYNLPTVEDPGEFKPSDHSFQIELDGKTYTVKSDEDVEAIATLIDEKPEIITASKFIAFNRQVSQMEEAIKREKADYDKKSEEYKEQSERQQTLANQLEVWSKEFDYLTDKGNIPAVAKEYVDADWTDAEVAKQEGVKERIEIMKWMEAENNRREKAGLQSMTSFVDAYTAMQLENMKKGSASADKKEKQARRAKGAMVGSSAPYSQTNVPKGEIIGEGGSLNDLTSW